MIQFETNNLTIFESALFRTTSTVLVTDDLVLVVDPNWLPQEVEAIRSHVEKVKGDRPVYLLFTHSDYDHIIGYRAFPEAKVIASSAFQKNAEKEKVLEEIRQFDDDYYILRDYPIEYPEVDVEVKKDGQTLALGQTRLTFYLAPGHNADGVFTIAEPEGLFIAGDYLSNIEFPFVYHSFEKYENTLKKVDSILGKHAIDLLIPGHGDVAITEEEILLRQQESFGYFEQLRESVLQKTPFGLEALWQRYRFRRNMINFHQANETLLRKELGL